MSHFDTQLNSLTLHFLVTAAELLLWYITGQWQVEYEPAACPCSQKSQPGVHQPPKEMDCPALHWWGLTSNAVWFWLPE